ncbi:UDP-N-acetylmuramate dehydrogenase [Chitinilyticum litopenaei]|uniref:UDP-N-acetylmuramate dehydrogenase n=1 Tax=Chitinilyticum litopenaei TaxID=1121276 RepID=UPI00040857E3|nr:UDP-N-acetylmuramate dehydrogenase [Chitinilyticum litopenaei]
MPELIPDFSLQACNTLGLAARAQWLARIDSHASLQAVLADPRVAGLSRRVLGGGSNLVLGGDVPGLVLKNEIGGRRLLREDEAAWYVAAGGGENWHDFVLWTLAQGWGGLENLALIPGTVGAAPVQNIGAYGAEIRDLLSELTAYALDGGEIRRFTQEDCRFGYRDSVFKQEEAGRWLIAEVVFRLPKNHRPNTAYGDIERELAEAGLPRTPQGVAQAVMQVRQRKLPDPAVIGNAGSFFKNPVVPAAVHAALLAQYPALVAYPAGPGAMKLAAGWLIEQCGWKGRRLGPVGMYDKQALVLVNHGGAIGADVTRLMQAVQAAVRERFGVGLEAEPVWW